MDMNGGQAQIQMQGGQQQFQQYQQQPQMMQGNMMQNQQMQNMMQQQQMMQPGPMAMGGQMAGIPQQNMGGYGFAAKPKVVRQKQYRDPYREYIKVAPQNIMYDRRVVRGNTFAALVIPVNMQPDPALIEKQRMEEAYMKQRQDEMRMRRQVQERQREREREEERDQNMQMQQQQRQNNWEELSDRQDYIPETEIQPDYYIDRPPTAIFIPNPKGEMKATQIFEGDPDLFDYENEVEPILQVLVGKSIEHARIEVIEEYENSILKKHKSEYQQVREAELMETQRLEEVRARRNDEIDRRNMQMRIAKNQNQLAEKKLLARQYAKNFLQTFKRDTLLRMVDLGTLRRPVDLSMGSVFVPQLYNQITADMQTHHDHQENIDDFLGESMRNIAISHKQSIVKELNKRQEKKKEELRKKKEEEDAKKRRKDKRAALRERDRLAKLKQAIQDQIITPAEQQDYNTKMKIYDVRDPASTNDGIIIIGGFVGELIISFTCMLDYILADPKHQNFAFTGEMIETFLIDMLNNDEWADGVCGITLNKSLDEITQGRDLQPSQVAKLAKEKQNMSDFGLKYMFEIQKDLVLVPDIVDVIYTSVCKIATRQKIEDQEIPEAPEEGEDQGDFDEKVAKMKEDNANAEIENSKYEKLQSKILIKIRGEDEYNEENEKALVKLNNFRETVIGENGQVLSARTDSAPNDGENPGTEEQFNPDKIPPKILVTTTKIGDTGDVVALYHPEAAYSVRKVIMEAARKNFKELEKAEISQLLLHSNQRSTMLENKFEEKFIKVHNYERGCQYQDPIQKLTFKTFLKD